MSKHRLFWTGVFVAAFVSGGAWLNGPATQATGADSKTVDDPGKPFFAQHCQACHAGAKPRGNFRLDSLSQNFGDRANRERWLTVLEQIRTGTMPPKEKPRPPAEDVKA